MKKVQPETIRSKIHLIYEIFFDVMTYSYLKVEGVRQLKVKNS